MMKMYESGFDFGSYVEEEPAENFTICEMVEESTSGDFGESAAEIPAPTPEPIVEPKIPAAPVPKYEISQRPMRAKKRH